MSRGFLASLLLAAFLLSPRPLAGASALDLKVNPHVCFTPCSISVQVHIERHPPKSYAVVVIDGPEYFALNKVPLPDTDKPILLPAIPYRGLGEGEYSIQASIVVGETEEEEKYVEGPITEAVRVAGENGI